MAKINGASLLVYSNGTLIAAQKSCTVSWEQDLPGATTKDSSGWEEHINGTRRATCDFDGLYSTTGLTANGLISYILSRSNIVLLIDGGGFPIVGEATPKGVSISAVKEEAATISGSFKFQGPAWMLTGTYANLMTDPDATANSYDTMTVSGISITSAINLAGGADVRSNSLPGGVTSGETYKLITFLTKNSGALPRVSLFEQGASYLSAAVIFVEGVNVITLTATSSGVSSGCLIIESLDAANFSCSNIYLFRV